MAFAAAYSLLMPLAVAVFALWLPLKTTGVTTLKDWQTLVGGVLAIAAAVLGGLFILNQTAESRRQEQARLARQQAAARSVLPLALSGLVEHAERIAVALDALRATAVRRIVRAPTGTTFTAPQVDPKVIEPLRSVIESASELIGDRVAQVIAEVQVLDARVRSVEKSLHPASHGIMPGTSSLVTTYNLIDYIINAATIYARSAALFSYARRETDAAPEHFPTEHQLVTALNLLGFDQSTHEEIYGMARARAARHHSTSPPDMHDCRSTE